MAKSLLLVILATIALIKCDGYDWVKNESSIIFEIETPSQSSQVSSSASESTVSESHTSSTQRNTESTTEEVTTESTTAKPPPKQSGCSYVLWDTSDVKYCWARCNSATTSGIFNTWCFTTDPDKGSKKVECTSDEQCRPDWKCKSSCGMFSPHWSSNSENKSSNSTEIKADDSLNK